MTCKVYLNKSIIFFKTIIQENFPEIKGNQTTCEKGFQVLGKIGPQH